MTNLIHFRYPSLRDKNTPRIILKANSSVNKTNTIAESQIPSAHGSYGELLFDERWRAKRAQILYRDRNRCVNCTSFENLQVHHRQYHFIVSLNQFKAPWDYEDRLLITLCRNCHNKGHNKFKVPTLPI